MPSSPEECAPLDRDNLALAASLQQSPERLARIEKERSMLDVYKAQHDELCHYKQAMQQAPREDHVAAAGDAVVEEPRVEVAGAQVDQDGPPVDIVAFLRAMLVWHGELRQAHPK